MAYPSRSKLHHAFIELAGRGYIAPQKAYWCCQSCAGADLPEGTTKYVFYHEQDFDNWKQSGSMYLAWGGDLDEILEVLTRHGLAVSHKGAERIKVGKDTPSLSL